MTCLWSHNISEAEKRKIPQSLETPSPLDDFASPQQGSLMWYKLQILIQFNQTFFFFFFLRKNSAEQHLWMKNLICSDKRKWSLFFTKNIFIQKVLASYDPNLHEYNSAQCIIKSLNSNLSENQLLFSSQFSENRISKAKNVINKVTGKHVSRNDKHLDFSIL